MENIEATLGNLKTLATTVATEDEKFHAAKKAEAEAETEVLARVVELVRPALKALSSKIYGDERGILLFVNVGYFFLMEDGTFTDLVDEELMTVSLTGVLRRGNLYAIVHALLDALERQASGNKGLRTKEATERASKLMAVAALL